MHRTLALVALLLILWPHLVLMGCSAEHPTGHEAHVDSVGGEHHGHDGPECRLIPTCGSAMAEGVVASGVVEPGAPPRLHARLRTADPSTAPVSADPPPPRRVA